MKKVFIMVMVFAGLMFARVQQVWVARYNGPENSADFAYALAIDDDGDVYVTGYGDPGFKYVTIKYDGITGAEIWVARYADSPGGGHAKAIVLDKDGDVFVTGIFYGLDTDWDYLTVKYDGSTGEELWVASYNGAGNSADYSKAIAVDDNGDIYVTGHAGEIDSRNATTVKYDGATGTELWVAHHNSMPPGAASASGLAVDDDGNVIVTGYTELGGFVVKYDGGTGTELWAASSVDLHMKFEAIALNGDGDVYVTGDLIDDELELRYCVVKKYDGATGTELWSVGRNGSANPLAVDIAVDGTGNAYIAGYEWVEGTAWNYVIVKYDGETGAERWASYYNGPWNRHDRPSAIALDSVGDVYVTGYSTGADFCRDYATVKFDGETGEKHWVARYGNPHYRHNDATAIALDSRGNVYVTGQSLESGIGWDYATIKYSQSVGWVEMELLPHDEANRRDAVGRGSWLAYHLERDLIYAAKGQRNQEIHVFDRTAGDEGKWLTEPLTEVPMDTVRPRPIDRGSRGVVADGYLYVIHGNNSTQFWRYPLDNGADEDSDNPWLPWQRLTDVPIGPSRRPVRGGGDLVYAEPYIYLLKGDRTEFYQYDIVTDEWTPLAAAPGGVIGDPPRWLRDSWLAFDGDNTIYAHKARYFDRAIPREDWANYLYAYDINGDVWSERMSGMPLLGPMGRRWRRRRSGEGAKGVFYDGRLYALKGGNTQQLWQYGIGTASWQHLDEMPLVGEDGRRRVNAGAYLLSVGNNTLYAFKGNRINQFWRYAVPLTDDVMVSVPPPAYSGALAEKLPTGQAVVRIGPNPLSGGMATLRYSLPQAGPAMVNVFDVTGRNVLSRNIATAQTGSVGLDLRNLSAGIYLLQVEAEGFSGRQKLVVQK